MKLTAKERHAIATMRKLDARQRDKQLGDMRRLVLANAITARVSGSRLKLVDDKKIEKAFGSPPKPKKRPARRGPGDPDKQT